MDTLLYFKIGESINDPKTWRNYCIAIPSHMYKKFCKTLVPIKMVEFSKKVIKFSSKFKKIIHYQLPNGCIHGPKITKIKHKNWYVSNKTMYVNGQRDGASIDYLNGIITNRLEFKNDKYHGVNKRYQNVEGVPTITYLEPFNNGVLHGALKQFNRDTGELIYTCDYFQGSKHGKEFKNSCGIYKCNYICGLKDGDETCETPTETTKTRWDLGKMHGERIRKEKETEKITLHEIYYEGDMIECIVESLKVE